MEKSQTFKESEVDQSQMLKPLDMKQKVKSHPTKKKSSMRRKGEAEEEKKDTGPMHSKELLKRALKKIYEMEAGNQTFIFLFTNTCSLSLYLYRFMLTII